MNFLYKSGRYLFGFAVLAFGIVQFAKGNFMDGFLHVRNTVPARTLLLYIVSSLFLISGSMILFNATVLAGARIAFYLFLALFIYPHFIDLISNIHDAGVWTVVGETLAFVGGALILSGIFMKKPTGKEPLMPFSKNKITTGRILFALSLLIFAVQHYMYVSYITPIVPYWIPFPVFWTYFVGAAFLLTGISLLINRKAQLSATLLGFMFLFWVIFLHIPRVAAFPQKELEWTSLYVAIGFCGMFFTIAGLSAKKIPVK